MRPSWLPLLFLVAGILAPATAVFWFMNEAASSQAESARRSVTEAYRGQLRLLRDRVDEFWKARAAAMDENAGGGTAADFLRSLQAAGADSIVLLDRNGVARYPSLPAALSPDPAQDRPEWADAQTLESRRDRLADAARRWGNLAKSERDPSLIARAAQAHIRCLVRMGDKDAALAAIQTYFSTGRAARATDLQGRLIAADELLLALRLMTHGNQRFPPTAGRLASLLNDYRGPAMPSAQRLFLMGELRTLAPDVAAFPTYEAERLAARFLEAEPPRPGKAGLEPCALPDVWKLTSPGRRAIALYRTDTVVAASARLLGEWNASRSVRFSFAPPGTAAGAEAVAAGPMLPGWQVSFSLIDAKPLEEAARRRMTSYLAVGALVIAAIALTGFIAVQSFRRQSRLARLKTDLVGAVSHELKTPLASIQLLVDSLLEDDQPASPKTREYLELIAGENMRLTRLIKNFLTFSRIERNRQRFDFAETRPSDVVDSALVSMRERWQAPGCHLNVEVTPGLPVLYADQDALVTVLLNLLDNAYNYTRAEKRISLRAYREDGHVIFAVTDNGIGIAPREQKRIFRHFYQVDRRLARETGGCGLGLSIVEFIVRAHGGAVRVESETGAGSTFSVRLPSKKDEARGASA